MARLSPRRAAAAPLAAYDAEIAAVAAHRRESSADRVWRAKSQLELGIVEDISWFNTNRLHGTLGATRSPAPWRRAGSNCEYGIRGVRSNDTAIAN